MSTHMRFPTAVHEQAAQSVVDFFAVHSQTRAVLLVNSCARGRAVPESDLDVAILVDAAMPKCDLLSLERQWHERYAELPVFRKLEELSRFARIHLEMFDGRFTPQRWDDGGGPDCFEIEIGNRVAYAAQMWQRGSAFADLRAIWLPYYDEPLRQQRLAMVQESCRLNIARIEPLVARNLHFQAFDRLYHAFQEFLQCVFISRRVYPLAYNKWLREQIEGWLELPAIYALLPSVLEVDRLESTELTFKGGHLLALLDAWTG